MLNKACGWTVIETGAVEGEVVMAAGARGLARWR